LNSLFCIWLINSTTNKIIVPNKSRSLSDSLQANLVILTKLLIIDRSVLSTLTIFQFHSRFSSFCILVLIPRTRGLSHSCTTEFISKKFNPATIYWPYPSQCCDLVNPGSNEFYYGVFWDLHDFNFGFYDLAVTKLLFCLFFRHMFSICNSLWRSNMLIA